MNIVYVLTSYDYNDDSDVFLGLYPTFNQAYNAAQEYIKDYDLKVEDEWKAYAQGMTEIMLENNTALSIEPCAVH